MTLEEALAMPPVQGMSLQDALALPPRDDSEGAEQDLEFSVGHVGPDTPLPPLPDDASEFEKLRHKRLTQLYTGEVAPEDAGKYDPERVARDRQQMLAERLTPEQQYEREYTAAEESSPEGKILNLPFIRGPGTGLQSKVSQLAETGLRLLPGEGAPSQLADKLGRQRMQEESHQQYLNEQQGKVAQYVSDIGKMFTQYDPGTVTLTGGQSIWAQMAAEGANDAYVKGRSAGLDGDSLDNYALASGAVNGVLGFFGGKLAGGLAPQVAAGLRNKATNILRGYAGDIGANFGQFFAQYALDKYHNVDPGQVTGEKLLDTLIATVLGRTAAHVAGGGNDQERIKDLSVVPEANVREKLSPLAAKAKAFIERQWPSRKAAQEAGIEEPMTAKQRHDVAAEAREVAQNVTTNEPQPSAATTTQEPFVPTGSESAFVPKSVLQFNAVSDQASRGVESLKRTFKKNFLSGGEQNEATRKLLFERNGTINGHLAELAQNGKALERVVRAEYNLPRTKQIPDAIAQTLDEALKDPAKMQALPTDVAVVLQKLRDHVDGLSQTVKGLPGISPDLTVTIDQNMGQYITRTYKKFGDTEGWIRKALGDPQIMQDFAAEVRQTSPNASDEEIKNLAEILLRRDTLDLSDLGRFSPRTQKYVDVLKERKNLSEAVRNLYGERKDVFENYTETVAKLSNLIANRQFVDNLKNIGLQQGFFSDRSQPQIGHTAEVNWKQLPQLRSLEGVLMDPVTANSVNDIYTVHVPSKLERLWLKPMIAAKAMKTVGSVRATLRNFTGNLPIAVANGAWDVRKMSAIRDTIHDLTKTGDAAMLAKLRRYHELGLIEGVNQESLRDMASRISASMEDYIAGIDSRDHFKNFTRGVASVYQSMDTVWKLHTFENEMQAYREAYPKMPQAELETMVARNVRNLTPTYSEASKAARWWSRNIPIGPFAMFNFEIMRTSAARARIMAQEFSSGNPVLQRHALKRAVGQALVLGVGYGVEKAAEWKLGMSDDEKEAMRSRVAPWQKNSPLIVTDYDKDKGTISYYDAGYNDPFSIFTNSIIALYRGHPLEAIQQASEPFLAEDLAWGAIVSALRNKDADGRPIYDEGLSPSQQWKQIGKYVAGRFVPGTFTDLDRIIKAATGVTSKSGKQYDLSNEITSLAAGARKETLDRAQADFYRNREYNERVQASERSIRATFLAKGSFDAEKATELYHSAEDARQKGLDQWRKFVDGSVLLGEKNPYQKVVSDVGAASKIVKLMYARQYRPYQFRSQDLAKMRRLPDGEARVALYLKLARERTSGSASTQSD